MPSTPIKKAGRHDITSLVRELLSAGKATTQEAIGAALEKKGHRVSQPKVSRLLHKIGAIKLVDAKGNNVYRLPHDYHLAHELLAPRAQTAIHQQVITVVTSDTLIVVRTHPGAASLVARALDQEAKTLDILGCVAGDDTVLVAPKSSKSIETIAKRIKKLLLI